MSRLSPPYCYACGTPATCVGRYEGREDYQYGCDTHCGHGCEDGRCRPVYPGAERPAVHRGIDPIVIVGEDNPYSVDERYALYHEPPNSAGGRLRRITGLRVTSYHRWTRRLNLCSGKWNDAEARERAESLELEEQRGVLVLLGAKVGRAFGVEEWCAVVGQWEPFQLRHNHSGFNRYLTLPHPSGRNRAWNEPGSFARARALLVEARPDIPWGDAERPEPAPVVRCTNCGKVTTDNVCPDCGFDEGGGNREEG